MNSRAFCLPERREDLLLVSSGFDLVGYLYPGRQFWISSSLFFCSHSCTEQACYHLCIFTVHGSFYLCWIHVLCSPCYWFYWDLMVAFLNWPVTDQLWFVFLLWDPLMWSCGCTSRSFCHNIHWQKAPGQFSKLKNKDSLKLLLLPHF